MDQVFNELSTSSRAYECKYKASEGIERLLLVSKRLKHFGFSNIIRTVENFAQLSVAPNYTIRDWAIDKNVGANIDLQRQLLTSATKSPYVESFVQEFEDSSILEFRFGDRIALGLGLANLWDIGALSLDCDERFCRAQIPLQKNEITEILDTNENIEVLSFYSIESINAVEEYLKQKQYDKITSGDLLIELSPEVLPSIKFSIEAKDQIKGFTGTEQHFPEIIRHLSILNQFMMSWNRGAYTPEGMSWSTESKSTMDAYGDKRIFKCSDGISRQFQLHTKLYSSNQRIYFDPICDSKVVHIGYIGKHLPTVKYK